MVYWFVLVEKGKAIKFGSNGCGESKVVQTKIKGCWSAKGWRWVCGRKVDAIGGRVGGYHDSTILSFSLDGVCHGGGLLVRGGGKASW